MDVKPNVNIGDLTKPIDTLVTRVCDGIAGVYRPLGTILNVKAAAVADRVRQTADAKLAVDLAISEEELGILRLQTEARLTAESLRHTRNLRNIVAKSEGFLLEGATPNQIDDDWIDHYSDKARKCSQKNIQALWARILAREANKPGSISKRTLSVLQDLDKESAQAFGQLARTVLRVHTKLSPDQADLRILIIEQDPDIPPLSMLLELDSIGLISMSNDITMSQTTGYSYFSYFDKRLKVIFEFKECDFDFGPIELRKPGIEIFQTLEPEEIPGRFDAFATLLKHRMYVKEVQIQ